MGWTRIGGLGVCVWHLCLCSVTDVHVAGVQVAGGDRARNWHALQPPSHGTALTEISVDKPTYIVSLHQRCIIRCYLFAYAISCRLLCFPPPLAQAISSRI